MNNINQINKSPTPVLYFSMACNELTWNKIQMKNRVKASAAPLVFDSLLLRGLNCQKNVSITSYSFPSIAAYPGSMKLAWGCKKENIDDSTFIRWLPTINLPFIKHFGFFVSAFFATFLWVLMNHKKKNKKIIIYSAFLPVAFPVLLFSKIFKISTCLVLTDLPEFMLLHEKQTKYYPQIFVNAYFRLTELVQKQFDKYVFLTEQMNYLINKRQKPYEIIEAICNAEKHSETTKVEKSVPKAIMYAGNLNKKLGISLLLQAFSKLDSHAELWIFGAGGCESEILKHKEKDNRVKFFGKVDRNTVLAYEKSATLLVNMRNPNDELTMYSFPSKTIEYMSSGTPVLTTKLPGIPEEYFKYCFTTDHYDIESICLKLKEVLSLDQNELTEIGAKAKEFVVTKKNHIVQGAKLLELLKR